MKPRITVITLGVDDLEKSFSFYHFGLGFPSNGIIGKEFENGAVAFFDLSNGLKLALWPRKSISIDTGLILNPPSSTEITLGHNVSSIDEVNETILLAKNAGAKIIKEAKETFWGGYAGYFCDLDGHLWEIVWNPELLP